MHDTPFSALSFRQVGGCDGDGHFGNLLSIFGTVTFSLVSLESPLGEQALLNHRGVGRGNKGSGEGGTPDSLRCQKVPARGGKQN